MGRGLGKLQRDILWALDRSRNHKHVGFYWGGWNHKEGYTTIQHDRAVIKLPKDVFDLAAVKLIVARMDRKRTRPCPDTYNGFCYEYSFDSAFYRAVKTLGERGWLEQRTYNRTDPDTGKQERIGKRIRLVSRPMCSVTFSNT